MATGTADANTRSFGNMAECSCCFPCELTHVRIFDRIVFHLWRVLCSLSGLGYCDGGAGG